MTSSWLFLSTLNYDARSTTHQIYRMHIFIPESMLISYVVIILQSYMGMKIHDHIYKSPFLYVFLSTMNITYILTILLRHFKKIIPRLYLGLESGLSLQISD